MAATSTYVKGYNGVDWNRRLLWSKGNWFLVHDVVTARQAGSYDLDITWKTIDRGNQRVEGPGRFMAQRSEPRPIRPGKKEAASPTPATGSARTPASALHIDPAVPLRAWVTNHVRQGISVPVSVLHQRQSVDLKAGQSTTFCSLLYATGSKHPTEFAVSTLRPKAYSTARGESPRRASVSLAQASETLALRGGNAPEEVFRVKSGRDDAVAGFGSDQAGSWRCSAQAWLVSGQTISLVAARSIGLGQGRLAFEPAANVNLDVGTGQMSVVAAQPTSVTAQGGVLVQSRQHLELPAGTHSIAVRGLETSALADIHREMPQTVSRQPPAAATRPAAKPLWNVILAPGAPVLRITSADVDGDGRPELLVACGRAGHAVSSNGKLLWSHHTEGVVRDVSLAHFTRGGPATILVSSADTYLYQLDPAGRPLRKDRMSGMYFNVDHGERPWGLYCTRAVDTKGTGTDDLLVTTLASMESLGLTPDGKKLWRTLAAYHGCMDMAVADVDRDGKPEIVIADKYGSVFVLRPDGSKLLSSNTSIGDVTFGLGDLDGDGRLEIVHGSSTGDLIAMNLKHRTLWRFDNYGYPVERICCVDLNGDGRPEILIASGTGYVYCLDARGTLLWQRRLGLAVHDVAVADGVIVAGTEEGEVHALDGTGKLLWSQSLGASVTRLAALPLDGRAAFIAGLADGRLLALPAK
jgi:outer membrane protein assembly factor BamB